MLSLLDIAERIQKGPKMEVNQWDRGLFKWTTEIAQRRELKCPPNPPFFNTDPKMAERAFEAGIDFLVEHGFFCISTNRVVQFTRDEVEEAIREIPDRIIVGEGHDARLITQQRPHADKAPNSWPGHHAPFTEELAPLVVKCFASIPTVDYLQGFNFRVVDGREIFGLPMEAYAARRELAWMREGIRKAGRPGMAVALYPISMRAAALLAPMDPDYGLRRTDGVLLATLPDVKMEADVLTAAIVLVQDYGCFNQCSAGTQMGGFCGGIEGAIVEAIARALGGWILYRGGPITNTISHVLDARSMRITIRPELEWGNSVMLQALNTYSKTICSRSGTGPAPIGSEEHLIEIALYSIRAAVDGCNLNITRQRPPHMNKAQTPLEGVWQWEVADAAIRAGIKPSQAEGIMSDLARSIDGKKVEIGPDVREVYDWVNNKPRPAYQEVYLRTKGRLSDLGLDFG